MSAGITREFIAAIPKTDLHVHLDGSLRLSTLIELAGKEKVKLPSVDEEGLLTSVFKENYADLPDYLKGFAYTCAVMQNEEYLERIAFELAEDNLNEGVRYIEVRFAPQLHINNHMDMKKVVQAVCRGLDRARKHHNQSTAIEQGKDISFEFGVIVCALRCFHDGMAPYYDGLFQAMSHAPRKEVFSTASLELARGAAILVEEEGLPVVGFDLAGEEAGYPADDHEDSFEYAHSHFLHKTVHAGEAYGPESIFQAITDCHADRIGHGTFLFSVDRIKDTRIDDREQYVRSLIDYIANQRISIEVSLTSNLQTIPSLKSVAEHPLRQMLEHSLSCSLCTDNRLISRTTVSRELTLAIEHLPVTRRQFRNMIIAGFKGSFFPRSYTEKRAYVRKVINRYDELEQTMLDSE